eukprot:CAMPEP_0176258292 /NCGR_PEP_ID=MMETSP0121_2-20121125/38483_1 /TAXON_ID=160619 /ORGANISM="Kryptoperidinium foliaceum, Strain CCMP 1326" /LENGTH=536 /DNA_ID=CAMNT_0017598149 /DNA_START=71 /DNA_END=1681 /DNA_ORIENTATION=-
MGPSTHGKGAGGKGAGGKGAGAEDQEDRETRRAQYFADLPVSLTDAEEVLRGALLEVAARLGNTRLSLVAQDPAVKEAKAGLDMPKGVGLATWIQQRIPEDFSLITESTNGGEPTLVAAGMEGTITESAAPAEGVNVDDFYASLPQDEFLEEELALREQIIAALRSCGGSQRLSQLTRGEHAKDLQQARAALLPKGAPLLGWLERRLGTEVRVSQDMRGANVAELIGKAAAGVKKGKGAGKGAGAEKGKGGGKGSALALKGGAIGERKVFRPSTLGGEEDDAAREEAKLAREARAQEFLDTLPGDRLTPEEQRFRELLISKLQAQGRSTRLSIICQEDDVRAAKVALLPPEVNVGSWIEHRIGGEVVLSRDDVNNIVAGLTTAVAAPVRRAAHGSASGLPDQPIKVINEERDAAMADYFATLGGLQPLEWKLRDLFVEAVRRAGGSSRIAGLLNGDMAMQAAWQDLKRKWLQMSPPLEATFAKWVELRLGDDVKFTREPFVQIKGGNKRAAPTTPLTRPVKAPRVAVPGPRGTYSR